MARKKREVEEEQPAGAPEWMVTFSDCMTLLLTFFVLLLSFCGFDEEVFTGLSASFAKALPSVWPASATQQESMWINEQIRNMEQANKGTETRTFADKEASNFMKEKKPLDFQNLKVFSVPSSSFFWGNGIAISESGREMLDAFALFLRSTPSRVVISENGSDGNQNIALQRAWGVLEYLTRKKGIKKEMFSITSSTTMRRSPSSQRMLEITLLERSVYE
jgi:flagellar motor protein MotB